LEAQILKEKLFLKALNQETGLPLLRLLLLMAMPSLLVSFLKAKNFKSSGS